MNYLTSCVTLGVVFLYLQFLGVSSQTCSDSTTAVGRCQTNFTTSVSTGSSKDNVCSASKIFLSCLDQVIKDCNLSEGSQIIATAKQTLDQYPCGDSGTVIGSFPLLIFGIIMYIFLLYRILNKIPSPLSNMQK
ncbi:uncharacterized protein LOC133202733 [Saccostrea echinata]|uniref:uncharacterized protein LOC133202733 n=1 Tax=Saccostrea echinata TaxID=191078 RepID=UPI002A83B724|nr:uncharacterized protein LOC133202733 [Saccostrea echinata]